MVNNIGYTFGSKPDYTVGNIVLTAGSKNFTVTDGANLQTANILPGYTILHPNGKLLVIATISDATSGTLRFDCPSDCGGTITTMIRYQSEGSSLSAAVRDLLSNINSGLLSSISSLSMTEGKMIVGDATAGTVKLVDMGRLENIRALTLSENQIIVGNGGDAVKAVTLNSDNVTQGTNNLYLTTAQKSTIDSLNTTYLPLTGGQITGDIVRVGTPRWANYEIQIDDGNLSANGLSWKPKSGGAETYVAYKAGGGVRIFVTGNGDVAQFGADGVAEFGRVRIGATSQYYEDGNIYGSKWGNTYLSDYIDIRINSIVNAASARLAGQIAYFVATSAPSGWLKANGALVSRATYPILWAFAQASGALVSEADWSNGRQGCFSVGDGSTTFRLPEMRSEFIRGLDDGRGIDSGRQIGSFQADEYKSHSHSTNIRNPDGSATAWGAVVTNSGGAAISTISAGGSETRPRNIALLGCIRYQ